MLFRIFETLALVLSFVVRQAIGQTYYGPEDPRVKVELVLQHPTNGVSLTADGRLFIVWSRVDGSTGPQLSEYDQSTNTSKPYPNEEWNSFKPGDDPATHFLGVNSQRIGPDGNLWIVDKGATGFSSPVILPDGPKVVCIDTKTNKVARTYLMGNVTDSHSLLDDIRFHNATGKAYLTDAGTPGLITLDLETGAAVRVLNDQLSTREYIPMSAEGSFLYLDGKPVYFYADQHEVSPDGKWYYYQPATGGMSRIETKWMDKAFYNSSFDSNAIMGKYVQPYAHTPATGGTAIDSEGNIYNTDVDSQRILKIFPNGTMTTLVQDPRLTWIDAMWIDCKKKLWMPAPQLNRGVPFNNGKDRIVKPLYVYSIDIGVGPSPIDHTC